MWVVFFFVSCSGTFLWNNLIEDVRGAGPIRELGRLGLRVLE